jgi:endonuclease/exonuclease/phosphatase family metal-dependent hydrolase
VEVLRVEAFPAHWPGPRPPLVVTLRRGDVELTVVGLHLKSGEIEGGPGEGPSGIRAREAAALGAWLADKPRTIVAGDFNARAGSPSLSALLPAGWSWPTIQSPAPPEAWTTWIDRAVIDQILPSPDLRVDPAEILPFDLDPAFADAQLRARSGFQAARLAGMPLAEVENLYRVSDHRPLRVRIVG